MSSIVRTLRSPESAAAMKRAFSLVCHMVASIEPSVA